MSIHWWANCSLTCMCSLDKTLHIPSQYQAWIYQKTWSLVTSIKTCYFIAIPESTSICLLGAGGIFISYLLPHFFLYFSHCQNDVMWRLVALWLRCWDLCMFDLILMKLSDHCSVIGNTNVSKQKHIIVY